MSLFVESIKTAIANFLSNDPLFWIITQSNGIQIISQTLVGNNEYTVILVDNNSRILMTIQIVQNARILLSTNITVLECFKCRMLTKMEYVMLIALIEQCPGLASFISYRILMHEYTEEVIYDSIFRIKIQNNILLSLTVSSVVSAQIDIKKEDDNNFKVIDESIISRRY